MDVCPLEFKIRLPSPTGFEPILEPNGYGEYARPTKAELALCTTSARIQICTKPEAFLAHQP